MDGPLTEADIKIKVIVEATIYEPTMKLMVIA